MSETERASAIYVGPAGWSYQDWIGPVYPPDKRVDELLTIAKYFNCIELNSSFYRVPSPQLVQSWAERLSGKPGFKLTAKVWQRFTHEMKGDRDEAERFIHVFDPLLDRGQLGAFLLQFPWSFADEPRQRRFLETLGGWFGKYPTAVELRHGSWNNPETFKLLTATGLSFCNVDQPLIGESMPPTEVATTPRLGYVRLHGRNYRDWVRKDAGRDERYDYLYADREIEEWKGRIQRLAATVHELYIITNNHFRGQALVNAFQIRAMLENRRQEMPGRLVAAYPILRNIAVDAPAQGELL
jgi:uncharacterized protein YecE (DUF72 family)